MKVLDHGFVKLRNISGPTRRLDRAFDADDIDPANSARMSFDQMDKGRTRDEDLKLCEYLIKNRHNTPWEMIEVWIEMKMPIFIARQFVRHRTVTINEVSARYIKLPAEWYIPEPKNVGVKPTSAKQGRVIAEGEVSETAVDFCRRLDLSCRESYAEYEHFLGEGIPPELARSFLHVNHYTHWLWKQDLHNVMHFLSLRDHVHAQHEAQVYAKAVLAHLDEFLPNSMALYRKYRRQQ